MSHRQPPTRIGLSLSYCSVFVLLFCPCPINLSLSCGSVLAPVGLPLVLLICSCPFSLHSSYALCLYTLVISSRSYLHTYGAFFIFSLLFCLTSAETLLFHLLSCPYINKRKHNKSNTWKNWFHTTCLMLLYLDPSQPCPLSLLLFIHTSVSRALTVVITSHIC